MPVPVHPITVRVEDSAEAPVHRSLLAGGGGRLHPDGQPWVDESNAAGTNRDVGAEWSAGDLRCGAAVELEERGEPIIQKQRQRQQQLEVLRGKLQLLERIRDRGDARERHRQGADPMPLGRSEALRDLQDRAPVAVQLLRELGHHMGRTADARGQEVVEDRLHGRTRGEWFRMGTRSVDTDPLQLREPPISHG